ncbi:MAG: FAD-dependent oxidoreductase [candidate division Zixibacteria bacterium]|nr:FAD-dependent oxidoreductase [candidate division Zixibacteria bacterium]
MHYVIIGNGVAGINAANQLRKRDETSSITIISKESDHFFSRTALMYVLCGQMSPSDVEPYPRDHYQRMNFTRVRDEVVALSPSETSLKLSSGETIQYDRLLIASGSMARSAGWPGEELDGVGNFVTWQNLEWLTEKSRTAKKAVVVGGGLIGIEVAETLLAAGIEVTFLIREKWFWPIAMDQNEGLMIIDHMRHHGCNVRLQTEVKKIISQEEKVTGVEIGDGEIVDCDIVVATIGVVPQTGWLVESGIELDKSGGIVVGDHLETNLPNIWAAGDCTSVVWFNGIRRPEQLWYTSRDQGRIVGLNMSGDKRVYKRSTFYNSAKLFDIEYTTAGYVNFNFEGEQNWYHREPDTNRTTRITYLPDGSVTGFNMLGRRWDHRILVDWVDEKRQLDWVLQNLHIANFDEEFFPSFKIDTQALKSGVV